MDNMLTLMQIAALAIAGMCFALLGSVKLPLARKLDIDEGKVGGLISVFGFTLIPMVVAAGFLVDWLGKQAVLGGGFVLVILSLFVLAHARRYAAALLAVLVLGTGWSALVNVLNVTSPPAFVPPDELPQRMAYAMNMGDFIFGMGTFVTPLIIIYCARRFGLIRTLYGFAAVSVIPLLLGLGVDWEALDVAATESVAGGLVKLLSDPIVWICSIAFFFHVPTEASVAMWATTLMADAVVAVLANIHGISLCHRIDAAGRSGHDFGHRDGRLQCRHHARHRILPGSHSDVHTDRRSGRYCRADLPNIDRDPAGSCRAIAPRASCRDVLLHRRDRLDRNPNLDWHVCEADHGSAKLSDRQRLGGVAVCALDRAGLALDLTTLEHEGRT